MTKISMQDMYTGEKAILVGNVRIPVMSIADSGRCRSPRPVMSIT